MSVQVVVPLVIFTVLPEMVQPPVATTVTGRPEVAVAVIVKVLPNAADAGAPASVMVWLVLFTVSVVLLSVALPRVVSPA